MIQFNLLPDVKQQYIKTVYRRRMVTVASMLVSGGFILIFVLMFLFVRVNQARHLEHLDNDITAGVSKLQENKDLNKILTVQNQLSSLPALHDKKVMTSRIFTYLQQLTPTKASVSDVDIDVVNKVINIKGSSDNLATINKFIDTIKFTNFKLDGDSPVEGKAFSGVVLKNFNIGSEVAGGTTQQVTYEISFSYDETIFKSTAKPGAPTVNSVRLTVPKIITTRSSTQQPADLFIENKTDQEDN
jgi:hypothetical protein